MNRPIDEVWAFFADVPAVAACLPGASLTGNTDGRTVVGKIRVKVGPISAEFHGTAQVTRDDATHSGTIKGSGRDPRSKSATRGLITYRLVPAGDVTKLLLSVGYRLTGPLAQFSRSDLMQGIAGRLVTMFAQNVEARLSGAPTPAQKSELRAGRMFFSVLVQTIRARLSRLIGR